MFLIVGNSHDDILFYETSLKNIREEIILNRYKALIGTINNQEVMLIHDIYTSYIASSILSYIIDKYFILLVICVGRCQAFTDNLKVGQVVISKNTIFGDVDQVGAVKGNHLGQIPGFDRFIQSDILLPGCRIFLLLNGLICLGRNSICEWSHLIGWLDRSLIPWSILEDRYMHRRVFVLGSSEW